MFRVINHSRGPKNIFNKRSIVVTVAGGSERSVDLSDQTVAYLRKTRANGGSLEVKESAGEEIEEFTGYPTTDPVFIKEQSPVDELLSRMSKISAQQFRAEAKEILGDKWPAGSIPNREGIIDLLNLHDGKGQIQ